ncbi:MAG: hypothetical protein JWL59_3851 [Chthoniobacteraceae bacterium]|nr:hypothetical protein [Chthoniobacteraceae bacterium]
MPYFLPSRIPELSGFNRPQQRFLWRAASELMNRDDPWFSPSLRYLFAGAAGLGVYAAVSIGLLSNGAIGLAVCGIIAFTIAGGSGLLYTHLLSSHMRQFLRIAIEQHGTELEEIG